MRAGSQRKQSMIWVTVLALLATIPVTNALTSGSASWAAGAAAVTAAPAGDGKTSATAGASCWGVKQQYPASPSGTYWLETPALKRPAQFLCDMTTSGGGWVLVARGRTNWSFAAAGQGSPTAIFTAPDGAGAFAPAALSNDTINALLGGTSTSALPDGIRLERAKTSDGSSRQDLRLFPTATKWTWSFQVGHLLTKVVIDGHTYNGGNTMDTSSPSVPGETVDDLASQQGFNRMFTFDWAGHAYYKGFSYGSGVSGASSDPSNYLWVSANEGSPEPFTKVWIRPEIANSAAGFTPIPSAGYPADAMPQDLKTQSEVAPWGVVGIDHTNEGVMEPYHTNVLSLRVDGNTVFVGGRFTGVQQGPTASPIAQPSLAAFDLDGNWLPGFRPQIDGRVWDMLVAPDGGLIIAGDFTNVNGVPNTSGIAKLDPATGAPMAGFRASATTTTGPRAVVHALTQFNGEIYAAGTFTRFQGGTWNPITVSSAIGFRATDGTPGTWRPRINGLVVRIRVTKAADRVMMAGYFDNINGDYNEGYYGITDIATGNVSAGIGPWSDTTGAVAKYQQAVNDLGDGRYLVGGSEHAFQMWDSQRQHLIDSTVTKQGGDTQAIELFNGKVFYSCHCGNNVYLGTNAWPNPTGFRSVEAINLVGEVDASTNQFAYDTNWVPAGLKGAAGEGVWAIDQDIRGCLWVGGDLDRGAYTGNAAVDWLGGFARFCPLDSTPPTKPGAFSAKLAGGAAYLKWGTSTDASGAVSYDIYRNDRVIATTYGTSFTDPGITGTVHYTVCAVDSRGNRSASPAPISVNGPAAKIVNAALAPS